MRKVAFITGATRGIGKACALRLAREGWDIVVAARSVEEDPRLPGTIHTAAAEIAQYGTDVLPVACNVRDAEQIQQAARIALDRFGRVDAVINNAGALWWRRMDETPVKRFDTLVGVNVRGTYAVTEAFLPAMKAQRGGHVITMSPPVDPAMAPGQIAYFISKFGMTLIALGVAEEMREYNIRGTALWPKTIIESYATINFGMGGKELWRKADIVADAVWEILQHPELSNGRALIDEEFLREVGYTDFDKYACVEGSTPLPLSPEVMAAARAIMSARKSTQ